VYDRPMIFYPIETLVKAGITDILIVTSGPHVGDFLGVLKNGKELGVNHLEYAYQEKPDGGIADALSIAKDFAGKDNITVILGDNTTDADISADVKNFSQGAVIFLKKVPDPERFGIAVFDQNDPQKVVRIDEKPKNPESDMAVTGLYIYDNNVFDYIKDIQPSGRGELEITDVNNRYIKDSVLRWTEVKGYWSDAGTFESLFKASSYWANKKGQIKT